jgi:hypothetical protein
MRSHACIALILCLHEGSASAQEQPGVDIAGDTAEVSALGGPGCLGTTREGTRALLAFGIVDYYGEWLEGGSFGPPRCWLKLSWAGAGETRRVTEDIELSCELVDSSPRYGPFPEALQAMVTRHDLVPCGIAEMRLDALAIRVLGEELEVFIRDEELWLRSPQGDLHWLHAFEPLDSGTTLVSVWVSSNGAHAFVVYDFGFAGWVEQRVIAFDPRPYLTATSE